jgi:hypothetical protein
MYGHVMSRNAGLGLVAAVLSLMALSTAQTQAASHPQRMPDPPAAAKPVTPGTETLGRADSWTAYASQDTTGRVCYLVGQPQRAEPAGFARKAPMAMVTHRPAEKIANVVSFVEGYALKEGSEVALDLGAGAKFELFTKDDGAWARTSEVDKAIVSSLLRSRQAVVHGTPSKGPATTDTYALAGFGKALALIDKACSVRRDDVPAVAATTPPAPAATPHKPVHHKARHVRHVKPARQASQASH